MESRKVIYFKSNGSLMDILTNKEIEFKIGRILNVLEGGNCTYHETEIDNEIYEIQLDSGAMVKLHTVLRHRNVGEYLLLSESNDVFNRLIASKQHEINQLETELKSAQEALQNLVQNKAYFIGE